MSVLALVREAAEHGDLWHTSHGKTLTLDGKRRKTIRVQCDIFNVLYGEQAAAYYPELLPAIRDAWVEVRP